MASPMAPSERIRGATPDADPSPRQCPLPEGDEGKVLFQV